VYPGNKGGQRRRANFRLASPLIWACLGGFTSLHVLYKQLHAGIGGYGQIIYAGFFCTLSKRLGRFAAVYLNCVA
jgi:hypothetical protein